MAEHEHHHKIVLEESEGLSEEKKITETPPANIIAGSILLGAIIVAASIVYGFQLTVQNSSLATEQQNSVSAVPLQQVTQADLVEVSKRDDEPVLGANNAKVTIVEFSDFQCPYCQSFFQNTFPQIKSKYIDTGKVKLVYRHFPLAFHVNAQISGMAAECANREGKFWEYHDLLFKNGKSDGEGLDSASLKKYADQLALNKGSLGFGNNKFNKCLDNSETSEVIAKDQAEGTKDSVTGTPTFFINGNKIVGAQSFSAFELVIESELKK